MDEQELSDMDAIQLALDVHLKRTYQNSQRFFFKKHELSETTHPLFVFYLEWLRAINAEPNKFDVLQQNEQKKYAFKFLLKHNLLFFLTVTRQFNVIAKLYKTPSYKAKLRHLHALVRKAHQKARQKKRKRLLMAKFNEKAKTYNLDRKKIDTHYPANAHDNKKISSRLSDEYNARKINDMAYAIKINHFRNTLKAIPKNAYVRASTQKTFQHQLTSMHQHTLNNKTSQQLTKNHSNNEDTTPQYVGFLSEAWQRPNTDLLHNQLTPELAERYNEEVAVFIKCAHEPEHEHHELQNELDLEKIDDVFTEEIDTHLNTYSEHPVDTKKSSFMNQRLTFFATIPQYKKEEAVQACCETTHSTRMGR